MNKNFWYKHIKFSMISIGLFLIGLGVVCIWFLYLPKTLIEISFIMIGAGLSTLVGEISYSHERFDYENKHKELIERIGIDTYSDCMNAAKLAFVLFYLCYFRKYLDFKKYKEYTLSLADSIKNKENIITFFGFLEKGDQDSKFAIIKMFDVIKNDIRSSQSRSSYNIIIIINILRLVGWYLGPFTDQTLNAWKIELIKEMNNIMIDQKIINKIDNNLKWINGKPSLNIRLLLFLTSLYILDMGLHYNEQIKLKEFMENFTLIYPNHFEDKALEISLLCGLRSENQFMYHSTLLPSE